MTTEEDIKRFMQVKEIFQLEWVPMKILVDTYYSLANSGAIKRIESLEREDKERLWAIIKSWIDGDQAYRLDCVKALHLVEELQNRKIEL